MTLTAEQRQAGREFRDACQARIRPADLVVPAWIRHYRHQCEARNRLSWTLNLVEHYIRSPDGLLCFYWKQGECRRCGLTARSDGQVWYADERPPLMGAIVEEFHA